MNLKMNKEEMQEILRGSNLSFEEKMTKKELLAIWENSQNKEEISENSLAIIETGISVKPLENEEIKEDHKEEVQTLSFEYEEVLKELGAEYYTPEENVFLIQGPKKKIAVLINNDLGNGFVYTVLNKKEFKKENARNILTLKSLKALKSYTISNLK